MNQAISLPVLLDKKFPGSWVVVVGDIAIIASSSRSRSDFERDIEVVLDPSLTILFQECLDMDMHIIINCSYSCD